MKTWWGDILRGALLAACLLAHAPADAQAGAPAAALVCHDDIYEPYFMLEDGQYRGINVDILTEAAHRIGLRVEFRILPFKRLESELARSRESGVTCAFALSRTPRREQFLEFGKVPLAVTEYTLFVRSDERAVAKLDDLAGKTIGVRAGFRLPEPVAEGVAAGRWRVAEVSSDSANFRKLAMHRVDAVLADRSIGLYTVRERPWEVRALAPPVARFDTYLVFAKSAQSEALAAAFDGALEGMQQDGTRERIAAGYFAPARR